MKERFFRNRTAVFTVVFVLLVGLVGILAPVIAPNDSYETNILNKFASYSLQYPLGTDQLGRCVLSRMIYGIRPTLGLALLTNRLCYDHLPRADMNAFRLAVHEAILEERN